MAFFSFCKARASICGRRSRERAVGSAVAGIMLRPISGCVAAGGISIAPSIAALVDVMLSEHRDLAAAKAFFRSAKTVTGVTPDRVTTDNHDGWVDAGRTAQEE